MSQMSRCIAVLTVHTLSLALAACTFEVESRDVPGATVTAPPSEPKQPDTPPSEPLKPTTMPQSACRLGEGPLVRLASYETRFSRAFAVVSAQGSFAIAAERELGVWSLAPEGPRLDAVVSGFGTEGASNAGKRSIAYAANGSRLAFSNSNGSVAVWDVAGRTIVAQLAPLISGMATLALSDDGSLVAVADASGAIRLWTPDTAEVIRAPQDLRTSALAFVPEQRDLFVAGTTLTGWSSIEVLQRWSHQNGFSQVGQCNVHSLEAVAITPSGAELVTIGGSALTRFNTADLTPSVVAAADEWHSPETLAMSPDGALFATLGREGTLRLFKTATMGEIARADVALQIGVVFDAAGERVVSVGREGTLHVFGCLR
jgi:WD40 repeat protein